MFATKNDFTLLARQIALSSRSGISTKDDRTPIAPILVDVYQIRLWKLIHTPNKLDVDAIADTFHVRCETCTCLERIPLSYICLF
jgi:hypothetical protein